VSVKRSCGLLSLSRSMWYYKSQRDDEEVMTKLDELADRYPTRGFDQYYKHIRSEGLKWNRKRVLRVYRLMKLHLRRKRKKRRIPARVKAPLRVPQAMNRTWSMDFMSDSLESGRRFRVLNVIDDHNRGALVVEPGFSLPAERVVEHLGRAIEINGKPKTIRVDNGPEFLSAVFQDYCEENRIEIQYIQPGRPMQNGYIERFNRTFREDVLDAWLFSGIRDASEKFDEWKQRYNNEHLHGSLGDMSPNDFAGQLSGASP
jgi:putative transposase